MLPQQNIVFNYGPMGNNLGKGNFFLVIFLLNIRNILLNLRKNKFSFWDINNAMTSEKGK